MARTIEPKEDYHDLTPKMQAIVDAIVADPDASNRNIAEQASENLPEGESVSVSYVRPVRNKQQHIIDERTEQALNERYEGQEETTGDPFEDVLDDESGWQTIGDRPVKQTTNNDTPTLTVELTESMVATILDGELPTDLRETVVNRVVSAAFEGGA